MPITTGKKKRRNLQSLDAAEFGTFRKRAKPMQRSKSSPAIVNSPPNTQLRVLTPKWFRKETILHFFKSSKNASHPVQPCASFTVFHKKTQASACSRDGCQGSSGTLTMVSNLDGHIRESTLIDASANPVTSPIGERSSDTLTVLTPSPPAITEGSERGFSLDGPAAEPDHSIPRRVRHLQTPQNNEPRKSKSMSDLVRIASNRVLSTATVIRRPRQAPRRPGILPMPHYNPLSPVSAPSSQFQFNPSSVLSTPSIASFRSTPPNSPASTQKTSTLPSSVSSHGTTGLRTSSTPINPISNLATIKEFPTNYHSIPVRETVVNIKPSLETIETTASIKVYLEMHFNSLLNGANSARSQRRRDFELYLSMTAMSFDQRQQARWHWEKVESENLRKHRLFVAASRKRRDHKGAAMAGYELIRVLGKGSFGVVRLVREKSVHEINGTPAKEPDHVEDEPRGRSSRRTAIDLRKAMSQVYAMKVIRKSDMLRNSQEAHLRAERDFLVASEKSRWVVPLIASFQDRANLYLVMEYMVGGDFLGLLLREDVLDEHFAKWYIAEMILCVEETHKMRWIHRDVKPDNFLITASGHLKISDFGLAFDGHWSHNQLYHNRNRYSMLEKFGYEIKGDEEDAQEDKLKEQITTGQNRKESMHFSASREGRREPVLDELNRVSKRKFAKSVVGTSQYMAPEVVRGEPYDGRCDWWSIGIILYECLYGCTPFFCENRLKTKERILDHTNSLAFSNRQRFARPGSDHIPLSPVTYEAVDLIMKLLQERQGRLSSARYRENDFLRRCSAVGLRYRSSCNGSNFVFPNDAEDIKSHCFFRDVDWEHLHMTSPPFIPRVQSNQSIAKYFESERDILSEGEDVDKESSASSDGVANPPEYPETARAVSEGRPEVKKKQKKRARDKILRDPTMRKTALEVRKQNAFIGYTYRRPKSVYLDSRMYGGGAPTPRRTVIPMTA